jgi:hypothetical protein
MIWGNKQQPAKITKRAKKKEGFFFFARFVVYFTSIDAADR